MSYLRPLVMKLENDRYEWYSPQSGRIQIAIAPQDNPIFCIPDNSCQSLDIYLVHNFYYFLCSPFDSLYLFSFSV